MAHFKPRRCESALAWKAWSLMLLLCSLALGERCASASVGQDYSLQSWQRQHGLPDNSIEALCQTRDGYLWVGTYSGLARFDGVKFTHFNPANLPGLPSAVCKALAEDDEGNLWIATEQGLVRWSGQALTVFTTRHGLSHDSVIRLCRGRQNRLWILTEAGLDRFDGGKFTRFTAADGLKFSSRATLHEDASGVLWVSRPGGVQHWNFQTEQFEDVLTGEFSDQSLAESLIGGQSNRLWLARAVRGINLNWSNNQFRDNQFQTCTIDEDAGFGSLMCLLPDRQDSLWIGTSWRGLYQFHDAQFKRYGKPDGLSDDYVICLTQDREGNLWIGTRHGGLNRWQPSPFLNYSTDDGLPHNKVWTICEGHDGSVWIGSDGGVSRWKQGRFTNLGAAEGLTNTMIRALHEDHEGTLWIGTGNGLFSLRDGRIASHRPVEGYWGCKVRVIHSDQAGTLWVGWENGLLQLTNGAWRNFTTKDGLAHNDVRAILEDRQGALWLGTFGGGVNRIHHGKIETFTVKDGLASDFAWTLYEDAKGVLWIVTESGLTRYENGRLVSYTTREGLFDNLINQILEDDREHLWLSCDRGIFRVSKQELDDVAQGKARSVQSVAYGEADGLLSAETNGRKSQPAGCTTRDGRLWFPTAKGVAIVDPAKLDYQELLPPVVIEEVQANGERIYSNSGVAAGVPPAVEPGVSPGGSTSASTATKELPKQGPGGKMPTSTAGGTPTATARSGLRKSEIRLPPGGARLLAFHYTANCLAAPEKVRFKYRLLGSHEEWIEAGVRRVAYYTNLRPGHYRFQVIACNHRGVWNSTGATQAFHLAPFLYQTWWFYAASVLLIGLGVWAVVRWRLHELRKIQALETQAGLSCELARISHDLHDALGSALTREALLITQAQCETERPASLRQHLESLQHTSSDARQTLKEIIWATNPRCDTLEHLVTYICQYAGQYLEPTGIRCRLAVPLDLPEREIPAAMRHHIFLTAKEALHNVVRHARATEVWIRAATDNATLRLSIEDNGVGSDPQLSTLNPQPSDGGHGLPNMKQRIHDCGGHFRLTTAPGQGTKIEIEVPLN